MLFFNLLVTYYINESAKKDLKNTVKGIEILVEQQLNGSNLNQNKSIELTIETKNLKKLKGALRLTKLSLNTEFLILSSDGKVLFPLNYNNTFVNKKIVNQAKTNLDNVQENVTVEFSKGRKKFYATYKNLSIKESSVKLVFISAVNTGSGMIQMINLLLLGVLLVAVGAGSFIALNVSKNISKPITRLSEQAKEIGSGNFITLAKEDSSIEVFDLTMNMNELSLRLKNNEQVQKNFLQNASHELRTPLMSIQGYAEGIANGIFPDTSKTAEIICGESRRLNLLVDELLMLSRLENNTWKSEIVNFNLCNMMKEYIQKINGYAIKEGKTIILNITDPNVIATFDENLLAQAVINIISNCIKYSKNEVLITIASEENNAVIKISDDGNGIDPNDLPHIFERFYKGKKGNQGLGLSIAKSAVELIGGSIKAYNHNGAVFELRLEQKSNQ